MELTLTNPHAVAAALHARPGDVRSIRLPANVDGTPWGDVAKLADKHGVAIARKGTGEHAEARVRPRRPMTWEEIVTAPRDDDRPQLWLALDQVQDPHNVGAIFRTAGYFGVRGILLSERRSASLTSTVYDVASGGVEAVPHAIETNLRRAIDRAKEAGIWALGTSEHAKESLQQAQPDRPWLVIVGNEESGLRRLTLESCDAVYRVPGAGDVDSLNVSVATGITLASLALAPPS